MKFGIILPNFTDDPAEAVREARKAEEVGLDGVFSYDHLFPMRQPERPSLSAFPLLGAVAQATTRVKVGTLVARIGVLPDAELVAEMKGLEEVAPGRVIAGLGIGDHLSRPESEAYGLPLFPIDDRYASLSWCAEHLKQAGIEVWLGGASERMREMAAEREMTLNVWLADPGGPGFTVDGVRSVAGGPGFTVDGVRSVAGDPGEKVAPVEPRVSALAAPGQPRSSRESLSDSALSLAGVLPNEEGELVEVIGECARHGYVSWVVAGRPVDIGLLGKVVRDFGG